MVVVKNLELAELANTIWSSLFSYHISGFPLQNLFSRRDTISLELLKLYAEILILRNKLLGNQADAVIRWKLLEYFISI